MSTKRYEFQITKDDYAVNPRVEWDNVGTMLCTHPRYNLGDVENLSSADILEQIADELKIDLTQWHDGEKSEEDLYKEVMSHDENGVVLPLSLYDHSGISMSVGVKQGWDSGQVGFIFVSYDNLKKAGIDDKYLQEQKEWTDGRTLKQVATDILTGEVEIYNNYLKGEVYEFAYTEYDANGIEVSSESCGGFFGDDITENGILDNLPAELAEKVKNGNKWAFNYSDQTTFVVATDQFQITDEIKAQAINKMLQFDIKNIMRAFQENGDSEFLSAALTGEGFTPYSKLDLKKLQEEYHSRFNSTIEKDFSTSQPLSSIQIDETMDVEKERADLERKVNSEQSRDVQQI